MTSAAHRADIARPASLFGVQRVDSKLRSRIDDMLELGLRDEVSMKKKKNKNGQRLFVCRNAGSFFLGHETHLPRR